MQVREDAQVLEKMDKGKPGTTQKAGTTSQNGTGLRPVCPESLMLEADRKHWERDGQGRGGQEGKKKRNHLAHKRGK